jgi:hypothetical protein
MIAHCTFWSELGSEFGNEFGSEFGNELGNEFGNELGNELGNEWRASCGHAMRCAALVTDPARYSP